MRAGARIGPRARSLNHPSVVIWSLCNEGMCDRGIKGGVPAFDA
eukprot:COSAG02_NODE_19409_length_883_cov_1.146684_2_plen_43_part_01